jgi:hypothetical protein
MTSEQTRPRDEFSSLGRASKMQELMDDMAMKPGDVLATTTPIRSPKTGIVLPRQGDLRQRDRESGPFSSFCC